MKAFNDLGKYLQWTTAALLEHLEYLQSELEDPDVDPFDDDYRAMFADYRAAHTAWIMRN